MISRTSSISALAVLLASAGAAAAFPATVTNDLNVRSGPGTGYSVVDSLQAGDTVEVVESSGSWYQLADGGWASASYLDADGSAAVDPGYAVVDPIPAITARPPSTMAAIPSSGMTAAITGTGAEAAATA